jgi:uncharacterized protein (DUF952 family)
MREKMKIYKILDRTDWAILRKSGRFDGSADDRRDGYIHLSTSAQVRGTAAKHFAGRGDIILLEIDADRIGDALRWESSRDGMLFPHLYGTLLQDMVVLSRPLPWDSVSHVFPAGL